MKYFESIDLSQHKTECAKQNPKHAKISVCVFVSLCMQACMVLSRCACENLCIWSQVCGSNKVFSELHTIGPINGRTFQSKGHTRRLFNHWEYISSQTQSWWHDCLNFWLLRSWQLNKPSFCQCKGGCTEDTWALFSLVSQLFGLKTYLLTGSLPLQKPLRFTMHQILTVVYE